MDLRKAIKTHIALMYESLFAEFNGRVVDLPLVCEISQLAHDFHRELKQIAGNFGEADPPEFDAEYAAMMADLDREIANATFDRQLHYADLPEDNTDEVSK